MRIPRKLEILRPLLRQQFHFWGGPKVYRARHEADLRILMYHNFPARQGALRQQCEHIRRYYQPVAMKQVSEALDGGVLPRHPVAITVDDGYRDFLTNGFPVFREFEIPVTVYLVSDFLDRRRWLWWNEIEYAIETCRQRVELKIGGKTIDVQPVGGKADENTSVAICEALKVLPQEERVQSVKDVLRQLTVTLPEELPQKWAPLSWEEVRQLAKQNIEFGAHTKTHPILSSISNPQQLQDEICGSKARVEEELRAPVLHFCYPNGKTRDIGARTLEITRQAGLRTGVTSEPGMNRIGQRPDGLQLRRLGVSPDYPLPYFAELLAGVRAS